MIIETVVSERPVPGSNKKRGKIRRTATRRACEKHAAVMLKWMTARVGR